MREAAFVGVGGAAVPLRCSRALAPARTATGCAPCFSLLVMALETLLARGFRPFAKLRRPLAELILVLLLAPDAAAQVSAGQAVRLIPTQGEVAAQASFDTSYMLGLYMSQLAAEGAAPNQADIDEATRQYFTNGAGVTGVPGSGPGAAYFTNGAAVTSVPNSGPGAAYFHNGAAVMAYYPTPEVIPAPVASAGAVTARIGSEQHEGEVGVERATASTEEAAPMAAAAAAAPVSEVRAAGTSLATGPTCSPAEIEMAMAIAREYATAASPFCAAPSTPTGPSTAFPLAPVETAPALAPEPPPSCPPAPAAGSALFSRLVVALGGALLGALAAVLWSRPRALHMAQRR